MSKNPRRTPQMVSMNRIFLVIGILALMAMVGYFYWDKQHRSQQNLPAPQLIP